MTPPIPVATFIHVLRKWIEALETDHAADARFFLEQIVPVGRLLAVDPAFQRLFLEQIEEQAAENGARDVEEALRCAQDYFRAVTRAALSRDYRNRE